MMAQEFTYYLQMSPDRVTYFFLILATWSFTLPVYTHI